MSRAHCLCWSLAVLALPAHADVSLTWTAQGGPCPVEPTALYVQGSMLRADTRQAGMDFSMIYDGVEQLGTQLDHNQRTVYQTEFDDDALDFQGDVAHATGVRVDKEMGKAQVEMEQAKVQMAEQCRELERQGMACPQIAMPDLSAMMDPENMQALMEQQQAAMAQMDPKMLERAGIDPDEVRRQQEQTSALMAAQGRLQGTRLVGDLGQHEVAGIACSIWEFRRGDEVVDRLCEAPIANLALDARDQRGLERAWRRIQQMATAWQETGQKIGEHFGDGVDASAAEGRERGLVLRKTCFDGARESGSAEVRVVRGPVDASVFTVPPGYRSPQQAARDMAPR
jgi:hypothetical protein